jgi:hypothetical protein
MDMASGLFFARPITGNGLNYCKNCDAPVFREPPLMCNSCDGSMCEPCTKNLCAYCLDEIERGRDE